ncbi:hypothetical protein CEXT_600001 [Caerostris extrusa]|uniref:Uncharacterized protein n=1 Tax=Caerostris extrusa TaxID=172846 RepID=A0AAV4RG58_CAEEX|nr:hypothetical protein CEXT_600001 [Caerostris extrusa]
MRFRIPLPGSAKKILLWKKFRLGSLAQNCLWEANGNEMLCANTIESRWSSLGLVALPLNDHGDSKAVWRHIVTFSDVWK